jgi:hypothetical protein
MLFVSLKTNTTNKYLLLFCRISEKILIVSQKTILNTSGFLSTFSQSGLLPKIRRLKYFYVKVKSLLIKFSSSLFLFALLFLSCSFFCDSVHFLCFPEILKFPLFVIFLTLFIFCMSNFLFI